MAQEGIRFTGFYAGASVCTPSRYALLTGRYPHRARDRAMLRWIEPPHETGGISASEITVAEKLRELGYATAAIGKWHLGDSEKFFPNNHGFDYWWGLPNNPYHGAYDKGVPLYENNTIAIQPADLTTLTQSYTEKAISFIEQSVAADKPFFLYLPHTYPTDRYIARRNSAAHQRAGCLVMWLKKLTGAPARSWQSSGNSILIQTPL